MSDKKGRPAANGAPLAITGGSAAPAIIRDSRACADAALAARIRCSASWRLAPMADGRRDPLDRPNRWRLSEGPAFRYVDPEQNTRDHTGRVVVSGLDRVLDGSPMSSPSRREIGAQRGRQGPARGCPA